MFSVAKVARNHGWFRGYADAEDDMKAASRLSLALLGTLLVISGALFFWRVDRSGEYYMHYHSSYRLLELARATRVVGAAESTTFFRELELARNAMEASEVQKKLLRILYANKVADYPDILLRYGVTDLENYRHLKKTLKS